MAERAVKVTKTYFSQFEYEIERTLSELNEWVLSVANLIKNDGKHYELYSRSRDAKKFFDEAVILQNFGNLFELDTAKFKLNYSTNACDSCMTYKDKNYFMEFSTAPVDGESDAFQREYLENNLSAPLLGQYKGEGSKHKGNRKIIPPSMNALPLDSVGLEISVLNKIGSVVKKKKNNNRYEDLRPIIIVISFCKKFDWEDKEVEAFQEFYEKNIEPFNTDEMQFVLMDYFLVGGKPKRIFMSDKFKMWLG